MKTLLTSLNTKYIHNNLAIQYLKSTVKDKYEVDTMDFTINQNLDDIIYNIMKNEYRIIGFSTYIWNIEETLKICEKIKKINKDIVIMLGGPEVSYNSKKILEDNKFLDYIMIGEGENSFPKLLDYINNEIDELPDGVVGNFENEILGDENFQIIQNLGDSNLEYTEEYIKGKKIIYYETSRGCPYNCEFCLSSATKKVRFFNLNKCKKDIKKFIDLKVPLVKFIDRTFNYNKEHALELLKFIVENDIGITTFHLEIHPTLIDEDYLNLFKNVRKDLFQFEIGVQSTNEITCKIIKRVGDFEKISEICKKILKYKNIHVHLDLIAGLPYEDFESLKNSFNDILSIRPDKLQLGFLKVLQGSPLWYKSDEYGIVYDNYAPYEVIYTNWISYNEMQKVKLVEAILDKYYNEKYFINTFEYIVNNYYKKDYDFFEEFANYWESKKYFDVNHSRDNLYKIFLEFIKFKNFSKLELIEELLIYDYILTNKKVPSFFNVRLVDNKIKHNILKENELLKQLNSKYLNIPTKKIVKNIFLVKFNYNIIHVIIDNTKNYSKGEFVLLYDKDSEQIEDITDLYREVR